MPGKSVIIIFFKVYLFILRERQQGRDRERERGRERIPSRLHAVSMEPNSGLDPTNEEMMT